MSGRYYNSDGQIYSVVNGIVSVDLVVEGELGQPPQETIAAKMVDGEFAEKCEESYASTMDNQTRSTVIAPDPAKTLVLNTKELDSYFSFYFFSVQVDLLFVYPTSLTRCFIERPSILKSS